MEEVISSLTQLDTSVFRNIISLKLDFNPFDDLSDNPTDWKEAESAANFTHHFSSHELQYQVIDYVFNQRHWNPSRFSDGSFPVWYASLELETTFYETAYHWKKFLLNTPELIENSQEKEIKNARSVFNVQCTGLSIDLKSKVKKFPYLVHQDNYDKTQKLGAVIHENNFPLAVFQSARFSSGMNVAAFSQLPLKTPSYFKDYVYSLDSSKMGNVSIVDVDSKNIEIKI